MDTVLQKPAAPAIAHIALWTRDLEAAAEFWNRYFGAEIGDLYESRRRPGFISRFLSLPGGGAQVELMSLSGLEDAPPWAVGWDHVAISLGSAEAVDSLARRCSVDGLLISQPRMTGDGYYEAVIAMPDGTRIEVTS